MDGHPRRPAGRRPGGRVASVAGQGALPGGAGRAGRRTVRRVLRHQASRAGPLRRPGHRLHRGTGRHPGRCGGAGVARKVAGAAGLRRPARLVSIVAFDVNGLKRVNDTVGHAEGDRLLTSVAALLIDHFSSLHGSLVARVGGDE
ncbi:MAG: diguanylate cyclase domain-containing protein [Nocardioidaceae bacterium]